MPIKHIFSNTIADATGTITVPTTAGGTATIAATNVIRPGDWNSAHNFTWNLAGNTTGASSVSGTDVPIAGLGGITVGGSNGSLIISAISNAIPNRYFKEVIQGERLTTVVGLSATQITNRPMLLPFWMEGTGMNPNTIRFLVSFGASSNRSLGGTFIAGLYSENNSTQMTLLGSTSWSISSTNTASSASWNGVAWVDFTGLSTITMTQEGRYVLAFQCNPVSANVTWMPASLYGADNMPVQSRIFSNGATSTLNATNQFVPFWGVYSTTTTNPPNAIGLSEVQGASSQQQIQFYAAIKEV